MHALPPTAFEQLDRDGFVVLPGFMPGGLLHELRREIDRVFREEGEQAGAEFKPEPGCRRLANLVGKGEVFRRVLKDQRLRSLVAHVLGPEFKLSSQNARSANPYNGVSQPLHADMSAVADERGFWVCNSVWMLDDFTPDNGALRAVPGSHHWKQLPQNVLDDPRAPHPDEVLLTGPAGTVVVMNAHLWHGGLENRTASPRRALHVFFCRRDKPQQQHQRRLIPADVQATLDDDLRRLLALDDPENDDLCGAEVVRSGFLK